MSHRAQEHHCCDLIGTKYLICVIGNTCVNPTISVQNGCCQQPQLATNFLQFFLNLFIKAVGKFTFYQRGQKINWEGRMSSHLGSAHLINIHSWMHLFNYLIIFSFLFSFIFSVVRVLALSVSSLACTLGKTKQLNKISDIIRLETDHWEFRK